MADNIRFDVDLNVKKESLNSLKQSLQDIQKITTSQFANMNKGLSTKEAASQLGEIKVTAFQVEAALKKAFNVDLGTVNISKFNQELGSSNLNINQLYSSFSKLGATGISAFRNLATQTLTTNIQLKQTHSLLDEMAETMGNTIKWGIASSVMNTFTGSIQQAFGYVKNLDSSLNDIRIVTGKSADEMSRFAETANDTAQRLGQGTTDYTRAALIYYQQGLSDAEAQARAEVTLKTANVTGQSAEAVSEQLTAVWSGYKVSADEAESYVDKLAAVAATTAADLEELSTGMSKVASAANAMGVDVDQLNAQLATIVSVTRQAPESVGTALRSIYARMGQLKADGSDDFGVTLGQYTENMRKMGIEILDQEGNMREMGEVIEEVAGKWENWTQAQRNAAAQAMAGTRQYNNLVALFDNWDMYNEALETSINAVGTLQEQQDIYMESTEAHLEKLRAAEENVYDSLINAESINPLIDALSSVNNFLANFIDGLGGGAQVLTSLGAIGVSVFSEQIAKGIGTTITNLQIARENAEMFNQAIKMAENIKSPDLDEVTSKIISAEEKLLQMSQFLTPDQTEAVQNTINTITQIGNEIDKLNEQKNQLDELIQKIGEYGEGWQSVEEILSNSSAQEKVLTYYQTQENNFNNITKSIRNYIKVAKEAESTNVINKDLEKNIETARIELQKIVDTLLTIGENFFTDTQKNSLTALKESLENINVAEGAKKAAEAIESISNRLMRFSETASQTSKQARTSLENEFEQGSNTVRAKIAENEEALQDAEKHLNKQVNTFSTSIKALELTKIVSGIGQIGMSIQQIQNLGSIWKNSDLSIGQKLLQTITNLAMSLPMLINGFNQAGTALGLFNIANHTTALEAGKAIFAENAHVIALKKVTDEAGKSRIAIKLFNSELTLTSAAAVSTGILGLVALFGILNSAYQQSIQSIINEKNQIIEEENQKQQQIESNRELWNSLNELQQKYEEGSVTRIELKSSIEDLINQYGLEEDAANNLRDSYDNLAESIRDARIARIEEAKASAESEKRAAEDILLNTTKQGGFFDNQNVFGGKYTLDLSSSPGGVTFGNTWEDESKFLIDKLKEAGGFLVRGEADDSSIHFNIDYNSESLVQLYDTLSKIYEEAQQELSDADRNSSELYKNLFNWLSQMKTPIEQYKAALQDSKEYSAELAILEAERSKIINFNEKNVENVNDYYVERLKLIAEIEKTGLTAQEAEQYADNFLLKNHQEIYDKYNDLANLVEIFYKNTGKIDQNVLDLINLLDEDQLEAFLAIDPRTFENWEDIKFILESISKMDFSNVSQLKYLNLNNIKSYQLAAAERYSQYNKVETTASAGKTISAEDYEKLDKITQQYFKMTSDGTYKLKSDTEDFYRTINNFKLQGFTDLLDGIKQQLDAINSLQKGQISNNYDTLSQEGLTQSESYVDENGTQHVGQLAIDYNLVNQQLEYLDAVTESNSVLGQSIELWKNQAEIQSLSVDQVRQIAEAVREVGDFTSLTKEETEALRQKYGETLQVLRDVMDPLDEDVNTDVFENFTDILLEDTDALLELTHTLDGDFQDAAEEVAEAVLRFDNAIVDATDHYEDWMKALQDDSLEDHAEVLNEVRNMYGDLLDIDPSTLSNDFLRDTSNLEKAKDALNGVESAYDELKNKAADDIIIHCNLDENTQANVYAKLAELRNQIDSFQGNDIELNAYLHSDGFRQALQEIVDMTGTSASQAQALLANALGVDVTCTEHTADTEEVQEISGFQAVFTPTPPASFIAPVMDGDSIREVEGTYQAQDLEYVPITVTTTAAKQNKSFTTTVDSVNGTTVGGGYKYAQASHGGGSKGPAHVGSGGGKKSGGGGGGGKKGKSSNPSKIEVKTDKSDRYHDVNLQLEKIATNYERLTKAEEKLTGKDLLDNLNAQLEILEKQKQTLEEKQKIQKGELKELRKTLGKTGVEFDTEGYMTNYNAEYDKRAKEIAKMEKKYNKMTDEEEQKKYKEKIEKKEKDFELWKEQTERYDELISKDIPDIEDQIQDAIDQQTAIRIQKFKMSIDLKLEMDDALREWNEFKEKVLKDFSDAVLPDKNGTIAGARRMYEDLRSYFEGPGGIGVTTSAINTLLDQINQINTTGTSSIYGDDAASALEDLKEYYQEAMEQLENIQDLVDEIKESYLDMIDEASEAFDNQVDQYEYINDLFEHSKDLIGLLYGDDAYAEMDVYYKKQRENNNKELDFLRRRVEYAQEMLDKETDPAAKEKWLEEWEDAVSALNDKVEDSVETIIDEYTNAIGGVFRELNSKVTNGLGLDYVNEEWDLINQNTDRYLDNINSMFVIQELENKYRDALDAEDSVAGQQKLNDMMKQQLAMLREKNRLTQYDVDRANKMFEITLKQIAAQNAQQNKSKMRLRRDSQGNYSYQFVSDEEEIAQAQRDLAAARNDLYNFDKEHYKENLNDMYSIYEDFQDRLYELYEDQTLTETEREERRVLLTQQYEELINQVVEENETARTNLRESAFNDLAELYDTNVSEFKSMSQDEQDELLTNLVPQWESGVQRMADVFAGEGGFKGVTLEAFEKLNEAIGTYEGALDELQLSAGQDFDLIGQGYDKISEKTQTLLQDNDKLITSYDKQVEAIKTVVSQMDILIGKYQAAQEAAKLAAEAGYTVAQQETNPQSEHDQMVETPNFTQVQPATPEEQAQLQQQLQQELPSVATTVPETVTSFMDDFGDATQGNGKLEIGDKVTFVGGKYYDDETGKGANKERGPGKKVKVTAIKSGAKYPIHVTSKKSADGWVKKKQLTGYDTGGYTGEWGDGSGRLALLHEKELVLNKSDTANILNAVSLIRDTGGLIESLTQAVNNRVSGMLNMGNSFNFGKDKQQLEQNVHITAEFPGVRDAKQIQDALDNLINVASQHAFNTQF